LGHHLIVERNLETLRRLHRRGFHPSTRHLFSLGAIALALGIAGGAEFLASAHDGPQHDPLQAAPHLGRTTDVAIGEEASFLAENDVAMKKMMNEMTVKPSGDVDRDFVAMMVPHHQGAIDMALAVLRCTGRAKRKQCRRRDRPCQQECDTSFHVVPPQMGTCRRERAARIWIKGTSNNDNFFVELIAGASRP
jgi:Domain of unknown function (DUF305)